MHDEGYIKFNCRWKHAAMPPSDELAALLHWRQRLHHAGLIGMYPDGIGYGNISHRWQGDQFIISGSATGGLPTLTAEHFSKVTAFDVAQNRVHCEGPIRASSESMSHAIIYQECPEVMGVVHVHHQKMWAHWINRLPTTDPQAAYGSPEMAHAIVRLLRGSSLRNNERIFVMGGHPEGLIAFGGSLKEAGELVLKMAADH